MQSSDSSIAIVGLGYVGLPLAVEFGRKRKVIGFDINETRIQELKQGIDKTLETTNQELRDAIHLSYTSLLEDLRHCKIFIVTVPTPIDKEKKPDLVPLERATEAIGSILKKGDIVIYESTVYPGATEDDCIPILEKFSGLKFNKDFYAGYSPERINPGDKEHTVEKILKVTSGSNKQTAKFVDKLYRSIVKVGTYKASSIKVAETAKNKVSLLMKEEGFDPTCDFVRVGVKSGGCSGLSYELKFDKTLHEGDKVFEDNHVKILVDKKADESDSTDHPVTINDLTPAKKNDLARPDKGIDSAIPEDVLHADKTTKSVLIRSKLEISLANNNPSSNLLSFILVEGVNTIPGSFKPSISSEIKACVANTINFVLVKLNFFKILSFA